jgi:Na+-translocating ferredoxin:NAD+ oxidoreductase RnfC subunit
MAILCRLLNGQFEIPHSFIEESVAVVVLVPLTWYKSPHSCGITGRAVSALLVAVMTETLPRTSRTKKSTLQADLVRAIRDGGVAGAGGAGFPTYAKWEQGDSADYLLMNHQESEPNFYIDKWLGQEYAAEFAALFDRLLADLFEVIVVGAKFKDRAYLHDLEALTDGTVYTPTELPLDPKKESGVVFAYTDSTYQYGMESVLLQVVADTVIGDDLPMDHGWIVQNTETLHNSNRAWNADEPVTRKYVHIDGEVPQHRLLDVPLGTPVQTILEQAFPAESIPLSETVLAHGGPGWCFPIEEPPEEFGVHKHTNGILVLDEETVEQNTLGENRINVLEAYDWTDRNLETEPTARVEPTCVRIPLVTNADLTGVVGPSKPSVSVGDDVEAGDIVATPTTDGVSIPQHASINGTVTAVEDTYVTVQAHNSPR